MKYVLYVVCYLITILILTFAWQAEHALPTLLLYSLAGLLLMLLSYPVTAKFLIFLLLAPWQEIVQVRRMRKHGAPRGYYPLVSIIIPAWNEAVGIVATIKTVFASSYQHIEIIVVNDGSTDNSEQVIQAFIRKYEKSMAGISSFPPIAYTYQNNAGKATALNTGISLSRGEIVLCIDADCLMSRDCILHLIRAFGDTTIMAACGNIKVGNTQALLSQIQMFEYAFSFFSRKADAILNTLYVISGACAAYRREVFDQVGLYGTSLRGGGEDVDLSIRVQQAGMRIAFVGQAVIYTEVPTTVKALIRQRVRWTRSRFETFRTYSHFVFSTKAGHNKLLTCLVFPVIIFNDWFYILKMLLRIGVYIFAVTTHVYQLLAMFMIISTILSIPAIWDNKEYRKYSFLIPIYWMLGFVPACIEAYAIAKALWGIARKQDVTWQKWQREGVIGS